MSTIPPETEGLPSGTGFPNANRAHPIVSVETALAEAARLCPDQLAILHGPDSLTYGELRAAVDNALSALGSLRGMRVLLVLPDSLESYLVHLVLFQAGATLIPLSPQSTGPRIADVISRIRPHLVVTNPVLFRGHRALLEEQACLLVKPRVPKSVVDAIPFEMAPGSPTLDELRARHTLHRTPLRYVIFTSGSTGVPKGVCLSEGNILSAGGMMVDFLALDSSTRSVVTIPLYDYYGLIQIYGHLLGHGGYALGLNVLFAQRFAATIATMQATDLVTVPFTLKQILEGPPDFVNRTLGSIRRITSSSDSLTETLLERLFSVNPDIAVVNIYGLTEAGRACYRYIRKDTPFSRSIGRPSRGVTVDIQGTPEAPGEIVIRGPNVMAGYLRGIENDQIIHSTCDAMPTGDTGYFNADGEIILLGRRDHMINLRGAKIHPSEIESAALRVPGIAEARARLVVEGDQDFIELEVVCPSGELPEAALKAAMNEHIPRIFVPSRVRRVDAFERTEIGSKMKR